MSAGRVSRVRSRPNTGSKCWLGIRRLDDQLIEMSEHIVERRLLSAPPRCYGGQLQLFTRSDADEIPGRNPSHAADSSTPVPSAFADDDAACAHGAQQARNAERRVAAQLYRIAEVIIEAAKNRVHTAQSTERLQVNRLAAHGEVRAFGERQSKLAREIGMLEVGLVERAWSQQNGQRFLVRLADAGKQALAQAAEESAHPAHAEITNRIGQHLLDDLAVFQRVAGSRRCLRTIGEHPPSTIRRAREVGGVDVQPVAALRRDAMAGPEEVGMTEGKLRRNDAFGKQTLRTVEIGQQRVEQRGALGYARFDRAPFISSENERQRVQVPTGRSAPCGSA